MRVYYNENDPKAADWLERLIDRGFIPKGRVDRRDIRDIRPRELLSFHQCHFFAGIGGWPYALNLALWPEDRPVWTGSCPCQPFSEAGRRLGFADQRHLWPHWFHLIDECRPATIFGEQVASKDGLAWLDLVQADVEAADYAFGAADLCAAGVGAPHIRQRLYWVANANRGDAYRDKKSYRKNSLPFQWTTEKIFFERDIGLNELGTMGITRRISSYGTARSLLHGIPGYLGLLKGYGNAIVPQVAAEFVRAFIEATSPDCNSLSMAN